MGTDADHSKGLVITDRRIGKTGKVALTVTLHGETIKVSKVDILDEKARDLFKTGLQQTCDALTEERHSSELDTQLLKIADKAALALNGVPMAPAASEAVEVDVSQIVRPERFITPDVSGLTMVKPMIRDGKPIGSWALYLRWTDGRREERDLTDTIDLPDGSRLWLHPQPAAPALSALPRWSSCSRQAWLGGAAPPDPAELFVQMLDAIAYHIDLPMDQRHGTAATLALWVMLTYVYHAWDAVPYLYLGGSTNSGKTRVLEVLGEMVFRPLPSSNMTAACLFRTLDEEGGTLLLDEAESLRGSGPDVGELRSILLSGYKRGSPARRLELVGDSYRPRHFDVYGPKALACIDGLPVTLANRCIRVSMFRCAPGSPMPMRRLRTDCDRWRNIRDGLHMLALEYGPRWLELTRAEDVCPVLIARQYELWQPLLALASFVEESGAEGTLDLMQQHVKASVEAGRDSQVPQADLILLEIITDAVKRHQQPTPTEVRDWAKDREPSLFANWGAEAVGRHLDHYGVKSRKSGDRRYRDVTLAQLWRVQRNYDIELGIGDDEIAEADTPQRSVQCAQPVQWPQEQQAGS